MPDPYPQLVQQFERLAQIDHAITFLQWDQLVMMPSGGNEARAKSLAELTALHHEFLTDPKMGDLIQAARETGYSGDQQRSVIEMERVWRQAVCLPPDLVRAKSLAGSKCEHGWRTQRAENDWNGFLRNFREVVRLSREEAQARQAAAPHRFATPYDALLDLYCTGDDSNFMAAVFAELKQALPEMVTRVLDRQRPPTDGLAGHYPVAAQKALSRKLMQRLGFDFDAGRLDVSKHPFSTGGRGDHRITTRYRETDFVQALMATAHETGHASYEAGLPAAWEGLPVGRARNMCIHESQSLLFEKHLFLSPAFTGHFAATIHDCLPAARRFPGDRIWAESVRVQPGKIRVEADEVTYPLHVILRFEIESGLMNGTTAAEEIPDLWDEKMTAMLGLSTAGNHTDGCLQDIHWTGGAFGYFPSYTIGAINAAQLFSAVCRVHPDWQDRLGRGDVHFLRSWLGEAVWQRGCLLDSQEILRSATGEGTHPKYLLDHLRSRYLD
jgi:carboxypeptidase Taq